MINPLKRVLGTIYPLSGKSFLQVPVLHNTGSFFRHLSLSITS